MKPTTITQKPEYAIDSTATMSAPLALAAAVGPQAARQGGEDR